MSKAIATTNEQRRVEFQTRDLYPVEDCNIIIPYLPTGYEDYSNMGYVDGQYQISDYLTYKRIGTGNDCFIVTGKGSTQIIDNDTSSPITATGQCGEYILGYNTSTFGDVSIETDTAFTDYKKTVSRNTLTFRIDAQRTNTDSVTELTENYKYMFYKVPEVTGDILLKVVSLETEYIGRKKIAYVLTLNSLQQDLETTGQARSQNVMPNAPGQGYYDPKIYDLETASDSDKTTISTFTADKDHLKVDANRWITYDIDKYVNDPVKYVVVKLFGNAFFCDFAMIGRRASKLEAGNQYGSPRGIFPINLSQATTPTLYRAQNPEDNFYGIYSFVPIIQMSKDFTDYFKDLFQVSASYSIQGIVKIPENYTFSNPETSDNNYQGTLYGSYDFSEGYVTLQKYGQFTLPTQISYNVSGVTGCSDTYTIYNTTERYIHDYIWDAFGCLKKVVQVPLMKKNTLTFGNLIGSGLSTAIGGLSSGSGFSAIFGLIAGASLFTIGIAATAIESISTPNLNEGLMGMMSASLLSMMCSETQNTVIASEEGYEYFFLNYLFGEGSNDYLTGFDTKSMMTAFQAELTDRFMRKGDTTTYTTDLIGQQTDSDGNNVLSDGTYLYIVGGETLQDMESDSQGFIIDGFNLQSVFSGDFSVEFLNADKEVIWYGVYMTSAKWTGSIRSLNTFKNTSIYGRENIYLSEPKDGPAQIVTYSGEVTYPNITINTNGSTGINYEWSYQNSTIISLDSYLTSNGWTRTAYGIGNDVDYTFFGQTLSICGAYSLDYTCDLVNLNSDFSTEILLMTSSVRITPDDFFTNYKKISINLNGNTIEVFNANSTTYSTETDSDGNYYVTARVTPNTTYSNRNSYNIPIADLSSSDGAECINVGKYTSYPSSYGFFDTGNNNGLFTMMVQNASGETVGSTNYYYTVEYVNEIVSGSVIRQKTYTIGAKLVFKTAGIYFQLTQLKIANHLVGQPTTSAYADSTVPNTSQVGTTPGYHFETLNKPYYNYLYLGKIATSATKSGGSSSSTKTYSDIYGDEKISYNSISISN